jgi:replicative DNA helicase
MEGLPNTIDIKEPPYSLDNEIEILGSILDDDRLLLDIKDNVKTSMFYNQFNQYIYTAMLYLFNTSVGISTATVVNRLQYKYPKNEELLSYALELRSAYLGKKSFEGKVELLKDDYQKRTMYDWALKRLTHDMSGIAGSNLVKEIEGMIDNMGIVSNIEYEKFEDYIDEWLKYQEDDTVVQSHKLGFKLLDELVLLEDSNLMLIGARPSVGKSAYATNLVKNFCLQGKHPLFVSLEMNKKEFMNRLVSNMARVEARKLKRKVDRTPSDWKDIMVAKDKISKFKFNFYDKGGMSIEQLIGLCRYLKKKNELDVLVIDYLQLLTSNEFRNQKQNQVSFISQKLKQLAMELEIPVIALSQLSRANVEHGKPREPFLSDLRDSGSLEQDANIVLMLHTDDVDQKFQDKRFIKLFVRKNRDGRLGQINYSYYGDYVHFEETLFNKQTCQYDVVDQDELTIPNENKNLGDLPF